MATSINSNIVLTLDGKQAEKMLSVLTKKSETLKEEIRDLGNKRVSIGLSADEAKHLDALQKEFRETRKAIRETATQIADVSSTINRISTAPIKEIERAIKAVTAQMKKLDRGTERYAERQKQLSLLRAELDRINRTGQKTAGTFDMIGKTAKRLASYVLVYAGFNQVVAGLRKMYDMNVALSDQLSDIEKTTGIAGSELAALSEDINKIDTRTSVEELNKLAVAAGKLGISGKKDVLEFVEAGNIINVALGEDLGEDAIKNIAKLNDVLGITKELGVEKSLLATGSAINELGQSSTASESYLVDFAGRLGGIAKQAGLTIQQVLALASASDQLKLENEVAATALNKVLTTLLSKTGQVAKAIGVTKQELQAALSGDTWSGLMMVLDKLSEKGGLAAIAPLMGDLGSDGARLNAVISALSSNTGKLRTELDIANKSFAEGTSVVDEYEKKNNNLAGTIEKIGKNIQHWFMGSGIIDWMLKVAQGIEKVTRGIGTLDERFKSQKEKVVSLSTDLRKLTSEYERLEGSNAAEDQERLKQVISEIVKVVPSAATAFDKYGNAISISTGRIDAFIEAQKSQLRVLNAELITETESEIKSTELTIARLKSQLNEIAQNQKLRVLDPVSGEFYDATEKQIAKVSEDYENAVANLDVLKNKLSDINGDFIEQEIIARRVAEIKAQIAADIKKEREEEERQRAALTQETEEEAKARIKASNSAIDQWLEKRKNSLKEARLAQQDINSENYVSEEEYNRALESLEMQALQKRLAILGLEPAEIEKIRGQILEIRQKMLDDAVKIQQKFQQVLLNADPVKKEEKEYQDRLRAVGLFGVEREDMTADQLKVLESLESQHQENILDIQRKARAREKRQAEEAFKQRVEQEYGVSYENWTTERNQEESSRKNDLDLQKSMGTLSVDEEFAREQAFFEWKMKALQEELALRQEVGADTQQIFKEIASTEKEAITSAIEHARNKFDAFKQVGETLGEAFGTVFEDVGEGFRNLGDALIDMAFDYLGQLAEMWLRELAMSAAKNVAEGTMKEIGTKGVLGLATAAAISAAIAGLLSVAKAGIKSALRGGDSSSSSGSSGQRVVKSSGFIVGGPTGDGDIHEVAGVVHRKEYVVPAWQMKDPVSFDYVRALETIRISRTPVNPLPRHGYLDGGGVRTTVPPINSSDPELTATLKGVQMLLQKLDKNGVTTLLSVSRLKETQDRFSASVLRGSRKK